MHGAGENYKIPNSSSHVAREFHLRLLRLAFVTVSLMQQAPPEITPTVNRVVEHTVERGVQGQAAAAAMLRRHHETVVIKESD